MWSPDWLYHVAQFQLVVVGALAITVIAHHPRLVVWGFALGLFNQWAWFYSAWHDAAWGLAVVNIVYTINYVRGIRRYRRLAREEVSLHVCACAGQADADSRGDTARET